LRTIHICATGSRRQPLNVYIDFITWLCPFWEWLQILLRQQLSTVNARLDVVPLLKIDVFEDIAPDDISGNGIAVHIDARQLRNYTLDGFQSPAEILFDGKHVGMNDLG
jgi:hypothetical protein